VLGVLTVLGVDAVLGALDVLAWACATAGAMSAAAI